ncbi:uncharacterized protein BBOV_IV005080 [Babesia bovis T2Bo]|uniref:S1 motif domain-containing protein n=1 Tax=Babesia bovis TaxID=5865 RepID=A7AQQ0_BABBO|nr:uncharacterized protein BBOV_IV005080 [Babesia bovis T2Bo]EDO06869.1 hypothetical protein BBOV_IV005080 [Babesia bovis T2Bo]|eukprot:XP_001610437.1 hypothetical protein [Babesia bovis T2Bo]
MDVEEDFPRSSEVVLESLGQPKRRDRSSEDKSNTFSFKVPTTSNRSLKSGKLFQRGRLPTYDKLEAGSLLLGSVAVIAPSGLRIHLPGGLVGFVRASDGVDIPESARQRPDTILSGCVSVGSRVVCSVLEVKRHFVLLSMRPSVINKGLSSGALTTGMLLPASVRAHEDHGIILGFHLGDSSSIGGFVRYDDVEKTENDNPPLDNDSPVLETGLTKREPPKDTFRELLTNLPLYSTVYVVVESVNESRQFATCRWPWSYEYPMPLDCSIPLLSVRPGLLLSGEISDIHIAASSLGGGSLSHCNYGFDLKCLNGLSAIVPALHSVVDYCNPSSSTGQQNVDTTGKATKKRRGKRVEELDDSSQEILGLEDIVIARVIYVNHWNKTVYVSLLSHVTKWTSPKGHRHRLVTPSLKTYCKVLRGIPGHGIIFSLYRIQTQEELDSGYSPESLVFSDTELGFCESSQLCDDKGDGPHSVVSSDAQLAMKFTLGSIHSCVEFGYDFLTRFVRLSTRESLQGESVLSPFHLSGGSLLKGVIAHIGSFGITVRLSTLVHGRVSLEHLTDVPLDTIPDRYSVGGTIKVRVLRFDHVHNILLLTAKRILRKDLNPLINLDQVVKGNEVLGYVSRVSQHSGDKVTIRFYNDLQTTLDPEEVSEAKRQDIDLRNGSVVRVVISKVDKRRRFFQVTLNPEKMSLLKAYGNDRAKRRREIRRAACKKAFTNHVSSRKHKESKS